MLLLVIDNYDSSTVNLVQHLGELGADMHGKTSRVTHGGTGVFEGVPNPVEVMRYHSLVVGHGSLPAALQIIATAADDPTEFHAVQHREHPVIGVQFHPESLGTPDGMRMLQNFLSFSAGVRA